MNDLFAISQIIKLHPSYSLVRDDIHLLYLQLGKSAQLVPDRLMQELKIQFPELFAFLHKNHELFRRHCEESVRLRLMGVHFVCYGEDLYPSSCYWMSEPPLTLSYMGAPAWQKERAIAVVGSREPSFESTQWMEKEFAPFCEAHRPCVISGGARGVDQKAHSLALRKSCRTVVVLPSGLGALYPASLKEWVEPILSGGGCFLSEYAFEQKMHKHLFHHRNRLIASLGAGTLLVEARKRSGTIITAQQTIQVGRPVWVVPGHPLDPHFVGSLELLAEGAVMVRDAQDLSIQFAGEFYKEKTDPTQVEMNLA